MTVLVTPEADALVVVARASGHQDPLAELTSMLANLTENRQRVVLELSEATLAPYARVAAFMKFVARRREESGCEIVVVADRLSARQVLRALSPDESVPVIPSLSAALGGRAVLQAPPAGLPVSQPVPRSARGRRRRQSGLGRVFMRRVGVLPAMAPMRGRLL